MSELAPKGLRQPRLTFEKALKKMLMQATTEEFYDLPWESEYHPDKKGTTRISVRGIWVAGSFARGATTCGDLDLILDVNLITGKSWPSKTTIKRQILGIYPHVSVYLGTPEANSSGVEFPEAVLLWSPGMPDWQSALASIKVDETAGHFAREYDILPLRREQFECRDYEFIVDMYKKKIIEWQWVLDDAIKKQDTEDGRNFLERLVWQEVGRKTLEALTDAIHYLCPQVPARFWNTDIWNKTGIRIGGYQVNTGKCPYLNIGMLDRVQYSALVIVPHKSRRGPNGLWIIRRGSEHPLVRFFADLSMFIAVAEDGFPRVIAGTFGAPTKGALYTNDLPKSVQKVSRNELLEAVSMMDQCTLNGKLYTYTHMYPTDQNPVFLKALHQKCHRGVKFQPPESLSDMENNYVQERIRETAA